MVWVTKQFHQVIQSNLLVPKRWVGHCWRSPTCNLWVKRSHNFASQKGHEYIFIGKCCFPTKGYISHDGSMGLVYWPTWTPYVYVNISYTRKFWRVVPKSNLQGLPMKWRVFRYSNSLRWVCQVATTVFPTLGKNDVFGRLGAFKATRKITLVRILFMYRMEKWHDSGFCVHAVPVKLPQTFRKPWAWQLISQNCLTLKQLGRLMHRLSWHLFHLAHERNQWRPHMLLLGACDNWLQDRWMRS